MPSESYQDAILASSNGAEGTAKHDPVACEKAPYTAYYANGTWYWQIRCPTCGNLRSQSLKSDGRDEMLCDGVQITRK